MLKLPWWMSWIPGPLRAFLNNPIVAAVAYVLAVGAGVAYQYLPEGKPKHLAGFLVGVLAALGVSANHSPVALPDVPKE